MDDINKKALKLAKEWDAGNPSMRPLRMPDGYKSKYIYRQPIVHAGIRPGHLPADSTYEAQGKWGIVSVIVDHELSLDEIRGRREALRDEGMTCVGAMRLTRQTFSLDIPQVRK